MDVCGHGSVGVSPYLVSNDKNKPAILVDYSRRKNVEIFCNSDSIILPIESVPILIHNLFVMYNIFDIEPKDGLVKVYQDVGRIIYKNSKSNNTSSCSCN